MTWAMYEGLHAACAHVDADTRVRVLLLRGAGDRAFVAGPDIGQFQAFTTAADALGYEERISRYVGRLEAVQKPTIALIHGYCVGGGAVLALACDLRLASPDAQFGVPIARTLGNTLSVENVARLLDLLGDARTKELLFTGRLVAADEARAVGVYNEVVAGGAARGARARAGGADRRECAAHAALDQGGRPPRPGARAAGAGRRPAPDVLPERRLPGGRARFPGQAPAALGRALMGQPPPDAPARRPLDGVRVLELANFMAGPYCGLVLADLGAEVVKIEQPRGGDFSRAHGPPFLDGESPCFLALNRNKRSLVLDLKTERAARALPPAVRRRTLVEQLPARGDGRPGPRLCDAPGGQPAADLSPVTGFGQDGPWPEAPRYDHIVQGMTGLMSDHRRGGTAAFRLGVLNRRSRPPPVHRERNPRRALRSRALRASASEINISLLASSVAALEAFQSRGLLRDRAAAATAWHGHPISAPYGRFAPPTAT